MCEEMIMYKKKPYMTIALIVINTLVFILLEFIGDTEDASFMISHGGMYPPDILEHMQIWRFFTSMFVHFGFLHLLNNMVLLGAAGVIVEDAMGHIAFMVIYLLSGIAGSVLSFAGMIKTDDYAVAAGASGAIFGLIGALVWIVIANKGQYKDLTKKGMIFMIILMLAYGFSTNGVDNFGHVGGLAAGFVISIVYYRKKRYN